MHPYIELNAHHIGKSHVQNGLTCEDYSASYSDDQVSIVVISDGHGDKNCFRSDKGARYACEIAISLCRQFQSITNHINDIDQCDFESLVVSLESDIADAWKEKVLSDANAHPFSDEELLIASEQAREIYKSGQRLEKAYGCTLILSMSTTYYWITIQIGDGKSIAAYKDGVFVEPVPVDENCLGNRSTSLCNSNAKEAFRHYYSKIKPIAAFVSSDGVEESFDQAGLYNFFFSTAYWLKEEGYDSARAKIDNLLPQISEGGSGDDVSLATMVSQTDSIGKPRLTLEQVHEKVDACANAEQQYRVQFANIQDRLAEKRKEEQAAANELKAIESKLVELSARHEQLAQDVSALSKSAETAKDAVKRASEQMERAEKYKVSAEAFWHPVLKKLGLYEEKPQEPVDGLSMASEGAISSNSDEPEKTQKESAETATAQNVYEEKEQAQHIEQAPVNGIEETGIPINAEEETPKKKKRFWFNKE